jgi:hypothetical protein
MTLSTTPTGWKLSCDAEECSSVWLLDRVSDPIGPAKRNGWVFGFNRQGEKVMPDDRCPPCVAAPPITRPERIDVPA